MAHTQKRINFSTQDLYDQERRNFNCPVAVVIKFSIDRRGSLPDHFLKSLLSNDVAIVACLGDNANAIEDEVDIFLEQNCKTEVTTTAHADEGLEEVFDYILMYMDLNFQQFHVVFEADKNDSDCSNWGELVERHYQSKR